MQLVAQHVIPGHVLGVADFAGLLSESLALAGPNLTTLLPGQPVKLFDGMHSLLVGTTNLVVASEAMARVVAAHLDQSDGFGFSCPPYHGSQDAWASDLTDYIACVSAWAGMRWGSTTGWQHATCNDMQHAMI